MTQSLTFDDGTVFESSKAMESIYGLYLYFGGGQGMTDVVSVLSDNKKTKRIQYDYYKVKLVFEGYTELITISDEGNAITAIMGKVGAE